MIPVIQVRVLEQLNLWDEQETIEALKTLKYGWQVSARSLPQISLNSASMGYYVSKVNTLLYRFLCFHPREKLVVDFLSSCRTLPGWHTEDIELIKEKIPLLHGNLGIGHYDIKEDTLFLDVCYGKSLCLKTELNIKDRRTLIGRGGTRTFDFSSLEQNK